MRSFKQGIHPPEEKKLSKDKKIVKIPPPSQVIIPLSQHTGAPCRPLVSKKDKVEKGQKIGDQDAFISSLKRPIAFFLISSVIKGLFTFSPLSFQFIRSLQFGIFLF